MICQSLPRISVVIWQFQSTACLSIGINQMAVQANLVIQRHYCLEVVVLQVMEGAIRLDKGTCLQ
jgi:hypothetical protein